MRVPRRTVTALSTVVITLLATFAVATSTAPATAATATPDGSSAARAAASCWEVKQVNPSAGDGQYWLQTPKLQTPTKVYCDMTTDGGGWVLVGRGRDGWIWSGDAQGTPAQVATTVDGTAAFSPRHLSDEVIDGLLDGGRVDALADGIRVRRATDTAGSTWQSSRIYTSNRDRWSWAFGAGLPVRSATVGGVTVSNTTTREIAGDAAYRRISTYETANNNWLRGFVFGAAGYGSSSTTSYVYSTATGGRYGTPFSQVYIRPTLTTGNVSYPAIADSGTAPQKAVPVAKSGALATSWGVTGTGTGGTGELATEAQAFAQIGSRMYVGGNFTTVQKGSAATGADKVAQPYLAAFDVATGDWISTFRPTVNGQVKSLAALPDGRLALGGEFTTVGGQAHAGLAVVNASTGAADATFDTQVENRVKNGKVSVRALEVSGGSLYAAGAFSHFVRGTSAVYVRNAGRITLSTQRADSTWNPVLNGTVADLDVSDDGTRVYLSGYFTTAGATAVSTPQAAALSTAAGAAVITPVWRPTFSTAGSARYQQAVQQVGPWVWLGGSQHSMFAYDTTSFGLQAAHITKSGGDLQTIASNGSVVYGGCHCGDWTYEGTTDYDGTTPGQTSVSWKQADKIAFVGAWDAATGHVLPQFAPQWKARNGYGAWSLTVASDGTLWAGGSFTSVVKENGSNQWVGGFARFAARPSTPPAAPSAAGVKLTGTQATVTWTQGATAGTTYEVLRNDRVVATSTGSSVTVPDSASGDRFFVRASDGQGNRSASTSVATVP